VSGQLHSPVALPPGERAPGTDWIGGWVDPRASLDDLEKRKFLTLPGLELQPVASRYTDYATPAPTLTLSSILMSSTHLFRSLLSDRFPNLPINILYFLSHAGCMFSLS
jgi:hypothetical protein